MNKPLLFVSHKHADATIATTVAKFVRMVTAGRVDVYLSSSPDFVGPSVGKTLSRELRNALWHAGVVILVYTSQDEDWSWCMWECGVADEPNSPHTKTIVLQCLRHDKPKVFQSAVRALAWDEASLINLAKRFQDPGFFPGVDGAVTELSVKEVEDAARQFHKELRAVIPKQPSENWSAWPFLRFELPRDVIDELGEEGLSSAERLARTEQALLEKARVRSTSSGLPRLFGRTDVPDGYPLRSLIDDWVERYPDVPLSWLGVLARQVMHGMNKQSPDVREWVRLREVTGSSEFVVGLGRIKSKPTAMQFDCYFLRVGEVPRVTQRMTRRDKMFYLDLAADPVAEQNLQELLQQLEERRWNRVPVLENGAARYIIHVSTIDRFIRRKAFEGVQVDQLTLEDLLSERSMHDMFTRNFIVLSERSTLAEAAMAMRQAPKAPVCQDVFITADGDPSEEVAGWLTDRDIALGDILGRVPETHRAVMEQKVALGTDNDLPLGETKAKRWAKKWNCRWNYLSESDKLLPYVDDNVSFDLDQIDTETGHVIGQGKSPYLGGSTYELIGRISKRDMGLMFYRFHGDLESLMGVLILRMRAGGDVHGWWLGLGKENVDVGGGFTWTDASRDTDFEPHEYDVSENPPRR